MNHSSAEDKKNMLNGNGKAKLADDEREIRHLKKALQKAVNKENAPESLRERIRKMIRE